MAPCPESPIQTLVRFRKWCIGRLRAAVKPLLVAHTDNPIDNKPPRAVYTRINNLWPCGSEDRPLSLRYSFFQATDNIIQSNRASKIHTVMKHIEEHVPGIKFIPIYEDRDAVIRIAFNHEHPHGKTWSRVGREAERVNSDEPTMNLSDVTGHESGFIQEASKEYGDIKRELLQTLGMHHEHQHPERKFTISATAVGQEEVVGQINLNQIAYSRPDMAICMTYHIGEWTKGGTEVKKPNKPSGPDFAWLNLMYPSHHRTKFEQALSELMDSRITKEQRNSIMKLYLDGEWDRVRSKIANLFNPKPKSSKKCVVAKMRAKMRANLFCKLG